MCFGGILKERCCQFRVNRSAFMVKNSSQVGLNSQMMLVLNHEKGLKFTLEWVF